MSMLYPFTLLFSSIKNKFTGIAGAVERLLQNGLLDPYSIEKADEETIKNLIYPVCCRQVDDKDDNSYMYCKLYNVEWKTFI